MLSEKKKGREGGSKRGRKRDINVREKHLLVVYSYAPPPGIELQPGYEP